MAGTPPTPSEDASTGAVNQADIDALLQGAGGSPADAASDPGEINQADIDALMKAASDGGLPEPPPVAESAPAADAGLDLPGRPFDEAAAAMQAAIEEERAAKAAQTASQKFAFPDLAAPQLRGVDPKKLSMLNDVKLRVKVELGRTRMLVEDVLQLGEGSVVELDKLAGDPVDVYANERLVARGEVLVLNDTFCVRVSEIVSNDPHRVSV